MLRKLLSALLFPTVLLSGLAIAIYGLEQGWPSFWRSYVIILVAVAIVVAMEYILPYDKGWHKSQGDVIPDILHLGLSSIAMGKLIAITFIALLAEASIYLSELIGSTIWPTGWHWAAQLMLALLAAGFTDYWAHRWSHEWEPLWRLHATHHSPERLYWLNAPRIHPFNKVLFVVTRTGTLALLGAPEDIFILYFVYNSIHGFFQHANIDVKLGPLNYFFSMSELHRWHHSKKVEESLNYGNDIIVWDLVFGTYFRPKERLIKGDEVGVSGMNFPKDFWSHMISPFTWKRFQSKE